MGLKVVWSTRAERELDEILDYWNKRNQNRKYSLKLLEFINSSIKNLSLQPEIGRITDNEVVRYIIVKDYFLYYSFDTYQLSIVDICDMRRDPDYIKSLIGL